MQTIGQSFTVLFLMLLFLYSVSQLIFKKMFPNYLHVQLIFLSFQCDLSHLLVPLSPFTLTETHCIQGEQVLT